MLRNFTIAMMSKICLLTLMFTLGHSIANAKDLGELTVNVVYQCPSFEYTTASFTPEKSGAYRINYSMNDRFAIYLNESLNVSAGEGDWTFMTENIEGLTIMGYETWEFEAGTTYYFGGGEGQGKFFMSDLKFIITETTSEVTLENTFPAENSVISIGTTEQVDFIFNGSVSLESATITTGTQSVNFPFNADPDCKVRVYANTVSVIFKDILLEWLNSGVLKADDIFTITLNGIGTSTDDGSVSVSFISAGIPGEMIGSTNTPDQMPSLKSYYMMADESE